MIESKKDLMRIDVNIEKMPIVFFGSKEKRESLERQIFKSKEPYEISSIIEGNTIKTLKINPSALGLPTEFDQDISVVVFYQFYDFFRKAGYCPRKLKIALSDFPKIMFLSKKGRLYKDIERSARRVSDCGIYQDKFVTVKEKTGKLKIYEQRSLKLFHSNGIYKETKETPNGKKIKKYYLDIELPEWVANNIEKFYTTEFDIRKYFMLKGGRTKKLYRLLELIRYETAKFIPYEKLRRELWIDEKEKFHIRRTLKRNLSPLIKSGYLKDFLFNNNGVIVTFSSIKKKRRLERQLTLEETINEQSLTLEMLEKLGDEQSKNFYRKIARMVPEELIYKCLSLAREVYENSQIKKSKGAIFTDVLKRECQKIGVALS